MSNAVLALDRVVAVARIPLEDVVAGAQEGDVVAVVAEHEVVAVAADEHVGALAAEQRVVAGAAIEGELDDAGRKGRGRDGVVAAETLDGEPVVRALGAGDIDLRRQAERPTREVPAPKTSMMSSPLVPLTRDIVGLAVAGRAADRAGEVDVHLGHVGAGEIVDGDVVGAAERVEVDLLDIVEVHDDVAEVAGQADALAVGRDVEDFVAGASR